MNRNMSVSTVLLSQVTYDLGLKIKRNETDRKCKHLRGSDSCHSEWVQSMGVISTTPAAALALHRTLKVFLETRELHCVDTEAAEDVKWWLQTSGMLNHCALGRIPRSSNLQNTNIFSVPLCIIIRGSVSNRAERSINSLIKVTHPQRNSVLRGPRIDFFNNED